MDLLSLLSAVPFEHHCKHIDITARKAYTYHIWQ